MIRSASLVMVWAGLIACLCLSFSSVSAQSGDGAGTASGRIILIEPKTPKGVLKVKESKDTRLVEATEGMLVHRGYLLVLDMTSTSSAKAVVICGDGKRHILSSGPQGCPCTSPCTPEICGIRYGRGTIGPTRGPDTDEGLFPVVISPRKTRLRNLRPTLRWTPVAGAKESTVYNVTLYGNSMKAIWSKDVAAATRLDYPDKALLLTPGQTYKFVVVSRDGLNSQQDTSPGIGFTVLTADQAQKLADEELKIKQLNLPEPQTRFLVANLYAARELYAEAIEQSEDLYTTMKVPAVARMLGDLYAAIGLNREAEKRYLETVEMTAVNDLDGQGLIQRNLAQVYEKLGIIDLAIARLEEAIKAYRGLGDNNTVRALLNEKRRLKNP